MSLNHLVIGGGETALDITTKSLLTGTDATGSGPVSIKTLPQAFDAAGIVFEEGQPDEKRIFATGGQIRVDTNPVGGTGAFMATGDNAWAAISDATRKKNVVECVDCLSKLASIKGYNFDYKVDDRDNSNRIGVLAQEVQAVFPEVISGYQDDEGSALGVKTVELIAPIISAINELRVRLEALEP